MIEKKPKLSVLIPTYNRVDMVGDALNSVLSQGFQDFEIVCSDNASTDGTYELLQSYSERDKRVKVFRNEKNLGPVANWRKCLDNSSGEFIHWLWSDDWIEENFYTDAFSIMEKGNVEILSTWNYRSDNPNDINEKYVSWRCSIPSLPGKEASKKILLSSGELPVSPAAYIIRRDLIVKNFYDHIVEVGVFTPASLGVGVDSLMVAGACAQVDKISILQKPSVVFRKHDNISVALSRDGRLSKLYLISHLWFMSKYRESLSLYEFMRLVVLILRVFRLDLLNPKLMFFVVVNFFRLKPSSGFWRIKAKYVSDKAIFKD